MQASSDEAESTVGGLDHIGYTLVQPDEEPSGAQSRKDERILDRLESAR